MPRTIEDTFGRYSHEEVLAALHDDVARRPDVRIEVYDRDGNLTNLEPIVAEATVEYDQTRLIHGSLTLTMQPIDELRSALFQYVLSPLVGLGPMPDGGTAWHRWGRYLWTRPTVDTAGLRPEAGGNLETWTVTLGDLNHLLDMAGPGRQGFVCDAGTPVSAWMAYAALLAGIEDVSRIEDSDILLSETLNWSLSGGARASRRLLDSEFKQLHSAWQALIAYLAQLREADPEAPVAPDPPEPTPVVTRSLQDQGIRWLDVFETLNGMSGYESTYRDMEGRIVCRPVFDPSRDDPTIRYVADQSSLLIGPLGADPDFSGIANVVYVIATSDANVNPGTIVGIADLDELLPDHPLAAANCHVTIEDGIQAEQPLSQAAADTQARKALFDSLKGYETVQFGSPLNPQYEGAEIVSMEVPGHADFGTPQVLSETLWTADLLRGRMTHSCSRVFRDFVVSQRAAEETEYQVYFLLQANGDYLLQASGDRLEKA